MSEGGVGFNGLLKIVEMSRSPVSEEEEMMVTASTAASNSPLFSLSSLHHGLLDLVKCLHTLISSGPIPKNYELES